MPGIQKLRSQQPTEQSAAADAWVAAAAGGWLGLALLKFGNPVVLESLVGAPSSFIEWLIESWPVAWGYGLLLIPLGVVLAFKDKNQLNFRWKLLAPVPWFLWQLISSWFTVDPGLSRMTLVHFVSCLAAFCVGYFGLARSGQHRVFWAYLILAFFLMTWAGLEQHYGGLDAVRKSVYEQPDWRSYPPEYLKKIASNRIFGTLFYPNALAGAILLIFPGVLVAAWQMAQKWDERLKLIWVGFLAYLGLATLYWTGSKSGWLIAIAGLLLVILHQEFSRRLKWTIIIVLAAGGLAGFGIKFAGYFQRGAPSASARLQYWRAALLTSQAHPWVGSGPGTFARAYSKLKPPGAEMARLTHNDYLEQASDSGIPGSLAYIGLIAGGVWRLYRKSREPFQPIVFAVWLGLLCFALQSFVEFGLYVPALAWIAFAWLGWGWAPRMKSTASSAGDKVPSA